MTRIRKVVAALCTGACLGLAGTTMAARADDHTVETPVRIEPQGDAVLVVDGVRYRGSLEITRSSDGGLDVVNVVDAGDYLRGVAEMPASWPRAALEAQAIVSRTQLAHALAAGRGTAAGRADVAADATGVPPYRGAGSESGEWAAALEATDGLVMRSGGRPADVHTSATSIDDAGSDSGAPLTSWAVSIPAGDLANALEAGGVSLPGGADPTTVRVDAGTVTVGTPAGELRTTTDAFARAVNTGAPASAPDRYPAPAEEQVDAGLTGGDGWGGPWPLPPRPDGDPPRLPLTLPSPHFQVSREGGAFVFAGRGWGSGFGMSKTDARQAADSGRSRDDILGAAFGNLDVGTEAPEGDVSVAIASGAEQVRLGADGGFFRIVGPDNRVAAQAAFGQWTATPSGEREVVLTGPDGADVALSVDGFTVPLRVVANRRLPVSFSLSRPAEVTLVVEGPLGTQSETSRHELGILPAGEGDQIGLDDLAPGAYRVSVEATAGDVTASSGWFTVDVAPARNGPSVLGATGLVIVLAVLLVGAIAARSRRRRSSPPV